MSASTISVSIITLLEPITAGRDILPSDGNGGPFPKVKNSFDDLRVTFFRSDSSSVSR